MPRKAELDETAVYIYIHGLADENGIVLLHKNVIDEMLKEFSTDRVRLRRAISNLVKKGRLIKGNTYYLYQISKK